jgi:hypothetical protein
MSLSSRARQSATALVAIVIAAALLVPAPAQAATGIGQTFTPTSPGSCNGDHLEVFQTGRADGTSYVVPAAGVLTSWSFMASALLTTLTLRVFRPATPPDQFTVVGDGGPQQAVAANSGLHKFPTRVPVRTGDIIGISASGGTCGSTGVAGDTARYRNIAGSGVPVGGTASYGVAPAFVLYDIAATWEPDADGDGYGDETQDACPSLAGAQSACPVPETTITKKPKNGSAGPNSKVKFVSSIPGSTFTCTLDGNKAKACTSPAKYRCLKPGKHTFSVFATTSVGQADPTPATKKFRVSANRHGC